MEWLRKLLEGAKKKEDGGVDIEDLMKQINTEFPKNAVPKETFNDINGQLKTANTTITDLKKNNGDNEALQKTIKEHEATIKTQKNDYDAKLKNLTLDSAIEKALTTSKAKHTDLLATKIDREKLVIAEDGKVTGLDDQLKGLKESYKDLFEEKISGREPANPENGVLGNNTYAALMANADNMTSEEVAAQFMAMQNNK
ncbi:MAG: phage scaffolding protein [Clostridium sp.]|uniref:phage scaffolding protein n=1 Tax=Clostridium sp. TaxID=1506 RepID=UPI00304835A5